jgi:hypothetical protein
MDNAAGSVDVSLDLFGSLDTELVPSELPEGVSPANVDVAYLPGSVFTRPSRKAALLMPPSAPIYAKTYVPPTQKPVTILLGQDGGFRTIDGSTYTTFGNTIPGNKVKSVTAFGREYFAISDGNLGQDIPRQFDGTFFDRVTQDGPGAPPAIANLQHPGVSMAASSNTLVRNNNQVLCTTAAPHNLKVGYQAQISNVPDSNATTVNQTGQASTFFAQNDWQQGGGGTYETISEPTTTALGDLIFSGFGMAIPNTATILGVVVGMGLISQSPTAGILSQVSLWNSAGILGSAKPESTEFTNVNTQQSYGSSADTWGLTPDKITPAVINDPSFGFSVAVSQPDNVRLFITQVYQITVYYTLSGSGTVGIVSSIVINNETNPGQALVTTSGPNGMVPGTFCSINGVEPAPVPGGLSAAQWATGLTTLRTVNNHNLGPGAVIQVLGVATSTSETAFSFNGNFTILTVPSPDQLTYEQTPITANDPDVIDGTTTSASVSVSWPIPDNTTTPSYFQVQSCPTLDSFYISLNYPDGIWTNGTVGFIWEGVFYVSQVVSPTQFYYAQQGPNGATTAVGTVTPFGQASPGTHQMVVMFQTRQGGITKPSPSIQFIANGGQYLNVTNIPIGPSNTVARILAFTGASGGNYFYLPVPASLNGQVTSTSTLIPDNTTAEITLDFSDNALFAATAIDIPGNNLFAQVVLGPCLGVFSYADRMIWWGERNKIPNLLNMGFDGGYQASTPANPLGWTVGSGGGGALVQSPSDAGGAWQITGDGTSNQRGLISQSAYQDSFFAAILQPSTQYTFRCWLSSPITAGNLGAFLVNSGGIIATASFIIQAGTGFVQADFSAMTPAQITPDTELQVFGINLQAGQVIVIDEMEIDYTDNLYIPYARVSYVNNPEGIDGVTGILGPDSDANPVRTFQKHRDNLCMLTTGPNGSLYETQDSSGSEPSSWNVAQIATLCGATSVWGDSSGEDWFVWASDTGLRAYEGGEVFKISQEIQTLWDAIAAPQNTVVVNDPVTRRIYILVSLASSSPATYVLDYRELNTAAAIDGSGPIKVSYSGRVLSTDVVRKWTTWTGPATFGGLLTLPDGTNQMCFTGAGVYKLLNDQQGIDDDTGSFQATYTTYAFTGTDNERQLQIGMHRKLFAFVSLSASGLGQIRLVPLAESLANRWAPTPWLPLQSSSMFDVECGLNVLATRCFFRIEGQPVAPGGPSFWSMNKMIFSVRADALIPVRGAF